MSELNQFRDRTQYMCRQKGWDKTSVNTVWLLLTEEIGELASAIRQNSKIYVKTGLKKKRGIDIQAEMGDVFSYLFQLAYMLNVDLDDMWEKHQVKINLRNYNNI
jgi:NTP pyrophosphatase (non-canonical NTP hydrolase)